MQAEEKKQRTGLQKTITFLWIVLLLLAAAVAGLLYLRNRAGKQAADAAQMLMEAIGISAPAADAPKVENPPAEESPSPEPTIEQSAEIDAGSITGEHRAEDDDGSLLEGGTYIEPALDEEEMQKLIDSVANKTNDGSVIGVLRIPKTDTLLPVIGEWSSKLLKISVCRYQGGLPNQQGNLVIIGHNYKNGAHFGCLKKLEVGDEVFLAGMDGIEKRYVVYQLDVVAPDDFSALDESRGTCGLSLMTCYQDGTNRLFVRCELADQQTEELENE